MQRHRKAEVEEAVHVAHRRDGERGMHQQVEQRPDHGNDERPAPKPPYQAGKNNRWHGEYGTEDDKEQIAT